MQEGVNFFYFYRMRLENYISDLLYRYECVTVPELGSFLSHELPARLDKDAQLFFPPTKRLSFNAQIMQNDGLLANYVSQCENMSYEDALLIIKSYVRSVLLKLEHGKEVRLLKVGTLSRKRSHEAESYSDKIVFEPEEGINYLTQSFGLTAVATRPVSRELYKHNVEVLEQKAPIALTHKKRTSQAWLKYAAIGFLAVGLSGTLGYLHLEQVESYNVAEKQTAEKQLENKIQQATFIIDNPLPAIVINGLKPRGKYHLVAGAFRNEENAGKRVEQLREKGYKARQIGENRFGLFQVVYDTYADPKIALAALREVRKNDNEGAWMLVQKLDQHNKN